MVRHEMHLCIFIPNNNKNLCVRTFQNDWFGVFELDFFFFFVIQVFVRLTGSEAVRIYYTLITKSGIVSHRTCYPANTHSMCLQCWFFTFLSLQLQIFRPHQKHLDCTRSFILEIGLVLFLCVLSLASSAAIRNKSDANLNNTVESCFSNVPVTYAVVVFNTFYLAYCFTGD